jgi:hypothetical protein
MPFSETGGVPLVLYDFDFSLSCEPSKDSSSGSWGAEASSLKTLVPKWLSSMPPYRKCKAMSYEWDALMHGGGRGAIVWLNTYRRHLRSISVFFRIFIEKGTSGFSRHVRNLVVAYNELVCSDFHCHSIGLLRSSISRLVVFLLLLVRAVTTFLAEAIGLLAR